MCLNGSIFISEQAKGDKTNETTDIYSIGIVLYEMLVGEPPFRERQL